MMICLSSSSKRRTHTAKPFHFLLFFKKVNNCYSKSTIRFHNNGPRSRICFFILVLFTG